jgi:hypothetical protein
MQTPKIKIERNSCDFVQSHILEKSEENRRNKYRSQAENQNRDPLNEKEY